MSGAQRIAGSPLTEDQTAARELMGGDQTHTCLVGGSRSGKTSLIVRMIIMRALRAPGSRHLMVRYRANALKASVWLDTFPKVMRMWFPGVEYLSRYGLFFELGDGSEIWGGGLDEEERVEKILGQEYATIYAGEVSQIPYSSILVLRTRLAQPGTGLRLRGFYDLNPTSTLHWSNVEFGDKMDPISKAPLPDPENYARMFLNPEGNRANLDPAYLLALSRMPKTFRQRFYEGKYVTDVDGALWPAALLELCRGEEIQPDPKGKKLGDFKQIVVGVDPSGALNKGDMKSDEIGILVAGKRHSNRCSVLEDATMKGSPKEWGRAVVAAYKKWKADHVVAEANFGGGMVEGTIKAIDPNVPVILVNASRGKVVRAEPVAALYEEKKVEHCGRFDLLEEQMQLFSRSGYKGDRSPDRADSAVWAITDLMLGEMSSYTLAHVR